MKFLPLILLAVAVSLDGFGVGVSYGLRNLRLPVPSLVTIALASALAIFVAMQAGHLVGSILPFPLTRWLGAMVLVLVGVWILAITFRPGTGQEGYRKPLTLSFRAFGFIVQIVRDPARADLDQSGEISTSEAILLGFALALDALGAGFGAALAGFSVIWTPLFVGLFKLALVSLGVCLGERCIQLNHRVSYLSGVILILLGIVNFF